ncbi:MAG: DUF488 family protein [Microbacteriaceae bacterium]|jgi:uncharacterized protein YeaO (DUF488 family)|nr:DUF488 family protein [Microbacteriaceae bacterium]HOA86803.1 DUF488 family protein [Microbacteriaceae bacterium]HPZ33592.1 DUF488 family protein [Microbacteriaceae bacterium]HQC93472.1 DUF488 family protein [Microbacteriaceae bacterium]
MVQFRIKRVYEPAAPDDGVRVLVDRLWPRGLTKERAAIDIWAKEAAPSTELRKRFHGGDESWEQFAVDYGAELRANPAVAELARQIADDPVVTLLFSVRDPEQNHAHLLQAALERALR